MRLSSNASSKGIIIVVASVAANNSNLGIDTHFNGATRDFAITKFELLLLSLSTTTK